MYTIFAWNICSATKFMIVQIQDKLIDLFILPIQLTDWLIKVEKQSISYFVNNNIFNP